MFCSCTFGEQLNLGPLHWAMSPAPGLFYFSVFYLKQGLTNSLCYPSWTQNYDPPAPVSQSAGITGVSHHSVTTNKTLNLGTSELSRKQFAELARNAWRKTLRLDVQDFVVNHLQTNSWGGAWGVHVPEESRAQGGSLLKWERRCCSVTTSLEVKNMVTDWFKE